MDSKEFRVRGKEMIDYVANYLETIEKRRVTPSIEPGYLKELIPLEAPERPEDWTTIMKDIDEKIMIGMTHWQHPRFHAYFPSGNSYPSILADILGDAIGCIGFSWAAGPACTELETIVLDWFGKMMGLPEQFLAGSENSKGGGVIQASASECVLVALLAARAQAIKKLKKQNPNADEGVLLSKLMAYCSKEAHSCLEKGAMIAFVKLRILEPDENFSLQGDTLRHAMEEDVKNGLLPFFVSTTVGTTSCCSVDNIKDIGPICAEYDAWLHVDAAYAGSAMICPELRHLFEGIQHAMSLNTNTNKWLLVNFDCSCMWVRDRFKLTQALVVDPLYLQHCYSEKSIDYRHWGIPLSRRFRALKLWFVIRTYGVEGLRSYIREHCRLAKVFEKLVKDDSRFEVMNNVLLGLVCFRLKGTNALNQKLLSTINASGKLHMVPASLNDKYVIRFCVCRESANDADMEFAWNVIKEYAADVTELYSSEVGQSQVSDTVIIPAPGSRRPSKEIAELYKDLGKRRFTLARQTSTITEVMGRTSFDLCDDDDVVQPRSRSGSLFPVSCFVDDFPQPTTSCRSRSGSLIPTTQNCSLLEDAKQKDDEEEESEEKVAELIKEKNQKSIKEKRSFFVRMVSDPKLYNPKIVKARVPPSRAIKASPTTSPRKTGGTGIENGVMPTNHASRSSKPSKASWISWPLAFVLQEVFDEVTNSEVPLRFRNWESTLTIKPGALGSSARTSPETENQNDKALMLSPNSQNTRRRSRSRSPLPPPKSPTAFLELEPKN